MSQESIHDACGRGDIDAVRASIAADPRVVDADDQYGWRPVFHAALHRHEPIVRLLIEAGADPVAKLSDESGTLIEWLAQYPEDTHFKAVVDVLNGHSA